MLISFIVWIVLGVVVGAIATKFVDTRGDSPVIGYAAAAVGAIVFGLAYRFMSESESPWGVVSLLLALVGAALGAAAYHLIRSRSISRERQSVRSSY